jgi:hypothetical protein
MTEACYSDNGYPRFHERCLFSGEQRWVLIFLRHRGVSCHLSSAEEAAAFGPSTAGRQLAAIMARPSHHRSLDRSWGAASQMRVSGAPYSAIRRPGYYLS